MKTRQQTLRIIQDNPNVSVLIIGGGVNGAGVFRELALQGVDCLLVDRADFVAGASSNSSRMIHGGLRYLENREFGLVAEALRERDRLLENAAHYVAPLKTTIPLYSWCGGLLRSALVFCGLSGKTGQRGAAPVKIGMWFYDFVTRRNRRLPTHFFRSREESLKEIPGLNANIVATATYYDAWISQTERLCIELIQDALRANAACRAVNYVGLADRNLSPGPSPKRRGENGAATDAIEPSMCATGNGAAVGAVARAGSTSDAENSNAASEAARAIHPQTAADGLPLAHGVALKDEISGETISVRPKIVINATGAWVDAANARLGLKTNFIGGTKGSHVVLDNAPLHAALGGRSGRMVYFQHSDGRVCIVFPFMDKVIAGTTDIRVSDPDAARCEESEVAYILETLRGVFPAIVISREQIVYTFCGVRPLPASSDELTGTISRGHSVRVIEPDGAREFPILCLIGGKWTTFRAFAEQIGEEILQRLALPRLCSTREVPIGGGKDFPADESQKSEWIKYVAQKSGLSEARVASLLERYGTVAEAFALEASEESERPLRSLPEYSVGEIERIAREEFVEHVDDIVRRRSTIALLGGARPEVLREIAKIAGRMLGWSAKRIEEEARSNA